MAGAGGFVLAHVSHDFSRPGSGTAPGSAQIQISPARAAVPPGGSVLLNCSVACGGDPVLGLETALTKREVSRGARWRLYALSGVREDSQPLCYAVCDGRQLSASASIFLYRFPERVELAPLPSWQPVGENVTLLCQVKGGAPRNQLTVELLRGEEVLSQGLPVGNPISATATVLAGREDHGANFSCRARLDLRPLGLELFYNTSVPRQLQTFVLPETEPKLSTPRVLEVGTRPQVTCSMDGLFPAPEAQVRMAVGDQQLIPTVTHSNGTVVASGNVATEQEGTQTLVCEVELGSRKRTTQSPLTAAEVSAGDQVTVDCEAGSGAVVTLSGAPAGSPSPRAQLQLRASAEDNGRRFSCSAALEVAGQVLRKNQTRALTVLYGPWLDERDCPGNWTWHEGSQQTLRCQASGNPHPELKCHRRNDNALLPIGDLRPVTRELEGTYVCVATSSRGQVTREVFLKVLYQQQSNMAWIVLAVAAITLGTVAAAACLYNRQRKIRQYRLQKAQEEALKLKAQATPP
ncbi:intercellular adhesion molecule 1 [Ctenodactylus gundi]